MPQTFHPDMERLLELVNDQFPPLKATDEIRVVVPLNPNAAIQRVVIYARLSKADRQRKQVSPEYQIRNASYLAQSMRWKVLGVFKDVGVSGRNFDRPEWERMMALIEMQSKTKEKVDAIVVDAISRFGRSVVEGLSVLDDLEGKGVLLRVSDNPYIAPETVQGRAYITSALLAAETERLEIVQRTKKALAEKRLQGQQVGSFPRYFQEDDERHIIPTETAHKVVWMRSRGAAYGTIAKQLGLRKQDAWNIAKYVARVKAQQVAQALAEEEAFA